MYGFIEGFSDTGERVEIDINSKPEVTQNE